MLTTIEKSHETIVRAVAHYFQVPVEELTTGRSKKTIDTYKRYVCFYLVKKNINKITWDNMAEIFSHKRTNIQYGFAKIESEMPIYRQTLADIETIQQLIDKFNALKKEQIFS